MNTECIHRKEREIIMNSKIITAAVLSLMLLTACGESAKTPTESPSATAPGNIIDDAGDALSDAERGVGDTMQDAGNAINKAADDMKTDK